MGEAKEHRVDDFAPGKGLELVDQDRKDLEGVKFRIELADGTTIDGMTEKDGLISIPADSDGDVKITIILVNDTDDENSD